KRQREGVEATGVVREGGTHVDQTFRCPMILKGAQRRFETLPVHVFSIANVQRPYQAMRNSEARAGKSPMDQAAIDQRYKLVRSIYFIGVRDWTSLEYVTPETVRVSNLRGET